MCVVDNSSQLIQHAYSESNTLWEKINFFIQSPPFQRALSIYRELALYKQENILEPEKLYLLGDRISRNMNYTDQRFINQTDVILLKRYYADIRGIRCFLYIFTSI